MATASGLQVNTYISPSGLADFMPEFNAIFKGDIISDVASAMEI
jgi:hypothetical protein